MNARWLGKRYYSLNAFFRARFGERVHRVSVDAGFNCPNRDGTKGTGGCVFCGETGARASYVDPELEVGEQLKRGIEAIGKKTGAKKFIAYFQAYTNTYADVYVLEALFRKALAFPEVAGISIGTRPDCVDGVKLDMLSNLAKEKMVLLEYGAQTMNEKTLASLNRGHTVEDTVRAITETKKRKNLSVLAHLILGLPGEGLPEARESVRKLAELGVDAFKFHHLFVEKGTALEKDYRNGIYRPLELNEYLEMLAALLPEIPPSVVIHRLFGDCEREKLIAPLWTLQKTENLRLLDKMLEERNIWQGRARTTGF